MNQPIRVAVLGAGGLGKAAARILDQKESMRLTAICDKGGVAVSPDGIPAEAVLSVKLGGTVGDIPQFGCRTGDSLAAVAELGDQLDAVFVALPNLPNDFIPGVIGRFVDAGVTAAFTDALKRTRAMEIMFALDDRLREAGVTYITGCGATPGLLTAAAVLAAQSFVKVDDVKIWWGVGIANWDEYRATIREDIAHLPGYDVERAKAMTDAEVDALLDERNGLLELHEMEHADDVLLERVGVVENRDRVHVGGVMDTRHAKKPVQTTMTLTGRTFEGKESAHQFVLGNETSMAANVVGPALGYLQRALWLQQRGLHGVFGSTEFLPCVVR